MGSLAEAPHEFLEGSLPTAWAVLIPSSAG